MKRVLVLGGTFDPVHNAHLQTAADVAELLGVERVRLIPCGKPVHRAQPSASAEQRLAMLQQAIDGKSHFEIDTQELDRDGPSYMVDTAKNLRAELGEDSCICLIVGMDAFLGLSSWHEWSKIPEYLNLIVMTRPGWQDVLIEQTELQALLKKSQVTTVDSLVSAAAGKILMVTVSELPISATQIREMVSEGESPDDLLPPAVLELIKIEKIYQNCV